MFSYEEGFSSINFRNIFLYMTIMSLMQKYRMHRRHILPKEDERKWPRLGDSAQRNHYAQKPVMAYPPYHPSQTLPAGQIYPAWVPPGSYPNGVHMWGSPYYPGWQLPAESWQWRPYSGVTFISFNTKVTFICLQFMILNENLHSSQLKSFHVFQMHADTWGCPVMPPPGSCPPFPRVSLFI